MEISFYRICSRVFQCVSFLALSFYSMKDTSAQYPANYQYTILPDPIITEIVNAASGDMAMKHLQGLAAYSRPRQPSEFPGNFRECSYIMEMLDEFGIENRSLDRVGATSSWRGTEGTVWEVSPGLSKIADYMDVPEMLAEGSNPVEMRAGLIWAGEGQPSFFDFNRQAVKGKIVVTSGNPWLVHPRAMNSGAAGVISFYSSRTLTDPVQIPNVEISGQGFVFMLPPREGVILRDRLLRRENIEVEVKISAAVDSADLLVPQCLIRGTDTTAGEIIFTAHLFEGFVKMGANDNMSGAAVILETARILNSLIESGRIPRPERGIRFLWVPEFSGTIPWVNMNLQRVRKAVCNINLDMTGLRLRDSRSFFQLYRSGHSTAHFANDILESYFRYVGETNVEGITDELDRRGFSRRIVSPTGTDDPFYYRIMPLHGSSDNAVFNDWSVNIPGIKMGTWPDDYYHSSEDQPDKCDPTQLRRAIFIAAAASYTIALGGETTALRILSEMQSMSAVRTGIQMAKAGDMIWKADRNNIGAVYKRATYNLEGSVIAEKTAVDKVRLVSGSPQVVTMINSQKEKLDELLRISLSSLREQMVNRCRILGVTQVEIRQDESERNASRLIPSPTDKATAMGYNGEWKSISSLPQEIVNKYKFKNIFNTDEVAGLADGKRNLLQIKKIIDSEFEMETPLDDMISYFRILQEAGLMKF